jgi:hypothetical protein
MHVCVFCEGLRPRFTTRCGPILPETNSFKYKDINGKAYYISRTQLSLLPAYMFMVNKIQGKSVEYALVDLKSAALRLYML